MANLRRILIVWGIIAAGFFVVLLVKDVTAYGGWIEARGDLRIMHRGHRIDVFDTISRHKVRYQIAGAAALIFLSTGLLIRIEKPRRS